MSPLNCKKARLLQIILIIQIIPVVLSICNDTNCNVCNSSSEYSCATCNSGFNLVNGTCCSSTLQNCASCYESPTTCYECQNDSLAIMGGQCKKCNDFIEGCVKCSNENQCLGCQQKHYVLNSSKKCKRCQESIQNCIECTSETECIKCKNDSFIINSSQCVACSSLMTNCITCTSSSDCLTCIDTYAINSSQCVACSSLMTNCVTCSTSLLCTSCANNSFAINPNTSKCQVCSFFMANCLSCNSPTSCTSCINNNFLLINNSCLSCSVFLSNCLSCSSSAICKTCTNTTYFMSTGKCVACSTYLTGCLACSSSSVCTSCSSNLQTLYQNKCTACNSLLSNCFTCSSSTACLSCVDNTFAVSLGVCVSCPILMTNCLRCSIPTACISCTSTFAVDPGTNLCRQCSLLIPNCWDCSSPTACTVCSNNTFYVNPTNNCATCLSAITNCLTCSSSTLCNSCINDTLAVNPSSKRCQICSTFMSYCTNCQNSTICTACTGSPNIILSKSKCQSCSAVIPRCLNCTRINYCTICSKYSLLVFSSQTVSSCPFCGELMPGCMDCISTSVCTKCISGQVVINGCSAIFGCLSVIRKPPVSICMSCDSSIFQPIPINGVCVCKKGHLAGKYCTQISGCTNIIRTISGDICIACSQFNRFYFNDGLCYCHQFYQLKGGMCKDICGDGVRLTLPCDDGNLISGDGCSQTCQIQPEYTCHGATKSSSICLYTGQINISTVCVYKLEDNTAKIVLSMSPYISNIHKSNVSLSFSISKNCSISSFQIVGSMIFIYISYQESIEGSSANITLPFDSNYITSSPASANVQMKDCGGDTLQYQPITKSSKQTIILMVKILSYSALVVWLLGSYSHKMIGVETLYSFQIIFVSHGFASRYFPVVKFFNQLKNTMNLLQDSFIAQAPLNPKLYHRLNYHSNIIYNDMFVIIAQALCLGIFVILTILYKLNCNRQPQQIKVSNSQEGSLTLKLAKLKKIVYEFLIFPLLIGFYINLVISLIIHFTSSIQKTVNNSIITLLLLFIVVATNIVFFQEWRFMVVESQPKEQKRYKQKYIPIYLTNLFIFTLIVVISLAGLISQPLYSLAGTAFVYTFIIIVLSPYRDRLHNLSIVVNQLGICLNFGWLISQRFIILPKDKEEMIAFAMLGWMTFIILLAIIRIIFQLQLSDLQTKMIVKNKKSTKILQQYENCYEQEISKAIDKQTEKNINIYRIQPQIIRERQLQQTMRQRINKYRKDYLQKSQKKLKEDIRTHHKENTNNMKQQSLQSPLRHK